MEVVGVQTKNDYEVVESRPSWELYQKLTFSFGNFGVLVNLENKAYFFNSMDDIMCAISRIQLARVVSIETKNEQIATFPRMFVVTTSDGIVEMIKTRGLNFMHEVILSYPIKLFADIELEGYIEKDFFLQKERVVEQITEFARVVDKRYKQNLGNIKRDWVVLESHRPKVGTKIQTYKISFHVICNHSVVIDDVEYPIYFGDVDQMNLFLTAVLQSDRFFDRGVFDVGFTLGKSLRMCGCATRKEPGRALNPTDEVPIETKKCSFEETIKKSILQLDTSCKQYACVSQHEENDDDDDPKSSSITNTMKKTRRCKIASISISEKRDVAEKFVAGYFDYVIKVFPVKFGFIKGFKDEIAVCKNGIEKGKYFSNAAGSTQSAGVDQVTINLATEKCILPNHKKHNHSTGRNLFVTKYKVVMYCQSTRHEKNKRTSTVWVNDRELRKVIDLLFE
jgi:hypothetical protein